MYSLLLTRVQDGAQAVSMPRARRLIEFHPFSHARAAESINARTAAHRRCAFAHA
ncbi:MAG TPA: hypothetical protein VHM30_13850 [Gemmatimonadaceae bacterium]|nr:hypothetical protein [Gemmatimonadaceae bacterium]